MQITKARLKQIIMEEIQKFVVVEQDEKLTPEEEEAASAGRGSAGLWDRYKCREAPRSVGVRPVAVGRLFVGALVCVCFVRWVFSVYFCCWCACVGASCRACRSWRQQVSK